jgi:hypothetical protein
MRDRISKAIVAGAMALSLAAAALATAEPAAAQWRSWNDGGQGSPGYMASGAPWGPPEAARDSAAYSWSGDDPWSGNDSCWQVRPIHSISGAWLDNRRVNVC